MKSALNSNLDALGPVPDIQDPLVPRHNYWPADPNGWARQAQALGDEARRNKAQIVFLGDSITQGWASEGKTEWDARFAPLGAVNLGIGGDRTQQILWRIAHGTLEGITPRLVVLKIGVNNLWQDVHHYGPACVAEGICRVVEAICRQCPQAKVLALGILPTQWQPEHPLRAIIRDINTRSAASLPTQDGRVRFADIGDRFLEQNGRIAPEIMPDACHLTPRGYALFADILDPMVRDMLA